MRYQLLAHVSLTEVDDEVVLLDLNSGAYYGLNHVGAKLMAAFQAQRSLAQATREIAEQYQIEHARVKTDITRLIEQLLDQKLIEQVSS